MEQQEINKAALEAASRVWAGEVAQGLHDMPAVDALILETPKKFAQWIFNNMSSYDAETS